MSLSTLHFGHYKAVIHDVKLCEMHAVFVDIAWNSGYSPKPWQKGLTVMLKKKQGVILVNKLRVILLMEADFNFANKTIFGHRMMHFAEDRNEIAKECAGSRQHHDNVTTAFHESYESFGSIGRMQQNLLVHSTMASNTDSQSSSSSTSFNHPSGFTTMYL